MKEKNKNKNNTLSDFIRYTRGEMTKREENAFQRKLQKDPFAEEATEGFSQISPREAADDLDRLGKLLKKRISPRQRTIYYSIAASVAVLMIISSVYLIVERKIPARQLSKAIVNPVLQEKVTDSNPSTESPVAESKNEMAAVENVPEQVITDDKIEAVIIADTEKLPVAKETEALAMVEKKDSNLYIAENQIAAPQDAAIKQDNAEVKEPEIKANKDLPALNEAVVVSYGTAKSSRAAAGVVNKADNAEVSYNPPQPVNGKESFDNYIRENIQKPAILGSGQSATVIATFIVRSTGSLDSIKVVSSPDNEFSLEAIRLIKDGPSWKSAESNGEKIDDEVRVSIVFR
jgi:hypothetical protein